ncbi:MAG TPA: 2-amino-4-hydroxy-6-hydroxymethyldihydropteridine diphosphokinase [Gammaproteobacteria bacterium]|jgi:2-amino-4-hydroxy-6-hydroxymethyldihydropteridine diphosphokinase|nr:2-amino-4-hydroxy-6-hydroxymethyldihydropteridine diphosphokinase [Gammaproteobacteria bacterium]
MEGVFIVSAKLNTVYIGLGSNLQQPLQQVMRAVDALRGTADLNQVRCSSLYRSLPLGPQDQPDFINAVVEAQTTLSPHALLAVLQALENDFGRERGGERWGPRVLDLDVLLHADTVISSEALVVPHPQLHRRAFVLRPLAELDENLSIPGLGSLQCLLSKLSPNDLAALEIVQPCSTSLLS